LYWPKVESLHIPVTEKVSKSQVAKASPITTAVQLRPQVETCKPSTCVKTPALKAVESK
jgi:hypothetical protein